MVGRDTCPEPYLDRLDRDKNTEFFAVGDSVLRFDILSPATRESWVVIGWLFAVRDPIRAGNGEPIHSKTE